MHNADTILKTLLNQQAEYPMATEVHYKPGKSTGAVIPLWLGQEQLWGKLTSEGKGYKGYLSSYQQERLHKVLLAYCHLNILKHVPK